MINWATTQQQGFDTQGGFQYRFTIERTGASPTFQYEWRVDAFNVNTGEWEVLDIPPRIACASWSDGATAVDAFFAYYLTQNPDGPPQLQPPHDPNG